MGMHIVTPNDWRRKILRLYMYSLIPSRTQAAR